MEGKRNLRKREVSTICFRSRFLASRTTREYFPARSLESVHRELVVMKTLRILLPLFACASLCAAQEPQQPSDSPTGLTVLKVKRERRREQAQDVRHTATDPDALNNTGVMPSGGGSNFPNFVLEYSAELKNDSPKAIKWLSWIYKVTDPDNKQEVDRQEFSSFDKISAGGKKTVNGIKRMPPMQTAPDTRKKNGNPFEEHVEFVCVAYDDGTLWRPSFIPESHCRDAEKRGKR